MGISKKDYSRRKQNMKRKLEELEKKAKNDFLNKDLHAEIADLKKKLEEM